LAGGDRPAQLDYGPRPASVVVPARRYCATRGFRRSRYGAISRRSCTVLRVTASGRLRRFGRGPVNVGSWHVRDVTPAATRAAAIKGGADIPARSPFMLRPRCRTLRALSCSDPKLGNSVIPEGFAWNEAELQRGDPLNRGLISLLVIKNDLTLALIGTAFIIQAEGSHATAVSAAHCFEQVRKILHPNVRRAAGVALFRDALRRRRGPRSTGGERGHTLAQRPQRGAEPRAPRT